MEEEYDIQCSYRNSRIYDNGAAGFLIDIDKQLRAVSKEWWVT